MHSILKVLDVAMRHCMGVKSTANRRLAVNTRYPISFLALLAVSILTLAYQVEAQRPRNRAQVHSLQATTDASGSHPDKTDITGPVTFTCLDQGYLRCSARVDIPAPGASPPS